MAQNIVILGTGGFGRELLAHIRSEGPHAGFEVLGFIDARPAASVMDNLPVLGDDDWAFVNLPATALFLTGLGKPSLRRALTEKWLLKGYKPAKYVHPSAQLLGTVSVGEGTMICAGCILTTNVKLGRGVLVNLSCTIAHDVQIGSYATLHPGVHVNGNVLIEEEAEIGTGAVILPGIRIGKMAVVGAGAVVTRDVADGARVAGVPAKDI